MNYGMLSVVAASMLAARMHNASPSALSTGALSAITAAVLGGVSFMGGGGSIAGLFWGLFLLNTFTNGIIVIDLQAYWQVVAQGGLLIIALCVDFFSIKARNSAMKRASMKKQA